MNIPSTFNYGNIYYHIVESVQNIYNSFLEKEQDDCENVDLRTAKPLRKGKAFFTSSHVKKNEGQ